MAILGVAVYGSNFQMPALENVFSRFAWRILNCRRRGRKSDVHIRREAEVRVGKVGDSRAVCVHFCTVYGVVYGFASASGTQKYFVNWNEDLLNT